MPDVSSLFSYRLFDQACSLFASLQLVLIAASKKPITTWMASIEPWLTQVPSKWIWAELKTLEGYKARDRYKLGKAVNEVHRALRRLKARGLQLVEKVSSRHAASPAHLTALLTSLRLPPTTPLACRRLIDVTMTRRDGEGYGGRERSSFRLGLGLFVHVELTLDVSLLNAARSLICLTTMKGEVIQVSDRMRCRAVRGSRSP